MQVIICGNNRIEPCKVPSKQYERHFYLTRDQLYKIYPDGLTRMTVTKYGHKANDDEVIFYKENAIVPHLERNQSYEMAKILSEIDEHKLMKGENKNIRGLAIKNVMSTWKQMLPIVPFILLGVIVLYSVVFS